MPQKIFLGRIVWADSGRSFKDEPSAKPQNPGASGGLGRLIKGPSLVVFRRRPLHRHAKEDSHA